MTESNESLISSDYGDLKKYDDEGANMNNGQGIDEADKLFEDEKRTMQSFYGNHEDVMK